MSNSIVNLISYTLGSGGRRLHLTAGGTIYAGTMVAQLTASGTVVAATTALSGAVIGVATHGATTGEEVEIETDREFLFANGTGDDACSSATLVGWTVYCGDDHTIFDNSAVGTLPYAGVFMGMDPSGKVRVLISPGTIAGSTAAANITVEDSAAYFTTDNVEAALAQIVADRASVAALKGANMTGYEDAGSKTTAATVDAALDELYVDATSTQGVIEIDLGSITDADGDQAKFANGGADGMTIADSKAVCYRINNDANPPKNLAGFSVPYDADVTANMTLKFLASKSGATLADATTITVEAFNQVSGALHDADDDYGGATNALTGDADAKTIATLSRTLALANLPAAGSKVSLTFKPTDGTLGTDDLLIHRMWVEYTRKLRTS